MQPPLILCKRFDRNRVGIVHLFRRHIYNDLANEIQQHLDERVEELIACGVSREEAEQQARREFGNVTLLEERGREVWQWFTLESIWADVKFAVRQLRKSPGFAATVIVTLALGIGANTAIFSIVDAVLLRPLPYKQPDRLMMVWQTDAAHRGTGAWFNTYREFDEWQRSSKSFEQLAALSWATTGTTMLLHGKPVDILPVPTSVNFFTMLGVAPLLGRTFEPADFANSCTLVLSHQFWQEKLGGIQNIVGQTLTLDRTQCVVVGVMPRDFSFYPTQANAWTLITPTSAFIKQPWDSMTGAFGRLKLGVTREAAQAELNAIQKRILPEASDLGTLKTAEPDVLEMQSEFTWLAGRNLRSALWVLSGAVALVLLIACVNVANLLLGRSIERSREMAIRSALGSGRRRLIRQMLTEALVLALCGTGAGIGLSVVLLKWFKAAHPVELPPGNTVTLHWQVLLFTAVLGTCSAIFFGLLPAFRASRVNLTAVLKSGERSAVVTVSTQRVSRILVVAQVALSLVLLAGAGLLIESLWRLAATPVGYRTDRLLTAWIHLPEDHYKTVDAKNDLYSNFAQKVAAQPGIQAVVGSSHFYPMGENQLSIEGQPVPPNGASSLVAAQDISANFFSIMRIPLFRGRSFDTRDRSNTQPVAIVNEALAKKYFPHDDPIGHAIKLGSTEDKSQPWMTIVGIAGDVKTTTVFQEMGYLVRPVVYRPLTQDIPSSFTVMIATQSDPLQTLGMVQQQLQFIDAELLLGDVETMTDKQSAVLSQPRFRTVLFGSFAALSLVLAMLGIYGLLTQAVLQRTRDIGIRMALGASRTSVLRNILREAFWTVLAGTLIGLACTVLAVRALSSLLYGVQAENTAVFFMSSVVLLAIALFASWLPARRAASIEPMQALRTE